MEIDAKTKNLVFKISLLLTGDIALWAVVFNDSFTVVSNAAFTFVGKTPLLSKRGTQKPKRHFNP